MSEFFIVVNFHNFPQKKDLAAYNLISRSNQSRLTRRGSEAFLDSYFVLGAVDCSAAAVVRAHKKSGWTWRSGVLHIRLDSHTTQMWGRCSSHFDNSAPWTAQVASLISKSSLPSVDFQYSRFKIVALQIMICKRFQCLVLEHIWALRGLYCDSL